MGRFSRDELSSAFEIYCEANDRASRACDWVAWADKFTEDVHYTDANGAPFQFPTWTLLHYAGENLWRYEEDNYNPGEAAGAIQAWLAAGGVLRVREQVNMTRT